MSQREWVASLHTVTARNIVWSLTFAASVYSSVCVLEIGVNSVKNHALLSDVR